MHEVGRSAWMDFLRCWSHALLQPLRTEVFSIHRAAEQLVRNGRGNAVHGIAMQSGSVTWLGLSEYKPQNGNRNMDGLTE
ncbi:MAG: hypothetical protein K0U78_07325 [Actinomycetia bacterium]|nr:hypothetical protein [Actinomycetes bacterium]